MNSSLFKGLAVVTAAAGLATVWPAAAASVSSTFDTGADGWSVTDINEVARAYGWAAADWAFSGGNPGGYISTLDVFATVGFLAPSKFTGDLSAFAGGNLSFDLIDTLNDGMSPAVVLYTAVGSIAYGAPPPSKTAWTTFSVPLTATGWTVYNGGGFVGSTPVTAAHFADTLADVRYFSILADWHTGYDDTSLDNVRLSSAVPEPADWSTAPLGFLGLSLVRHRARRISEPERLTVRARWSPPIGPWDGRGELISEVRARGRIPIEDRYARRRRSVPQSLMRAEVSRARHRTQAPRGARRQHRSPRF